jgi:methionyl aminopeptidase
VPNWFNARQKDVLTEGLVITIEPIIVSGRQETSEDADGWTIRTKDGGLAAHHEHTLVIRRGKPVLLTAA